MHAIYNTLWHCGSRPAQHAMSCSAVRSLLQMQKTALAWTLMSSTARNMMSHCFQVTYVKLQHFWKFIQQMCLSMVMHVLNTCTCDALSWHCTSSGHVRQGVNMGKHKWAVYPHFRGSWGGYRMGQLAPQRGCGASRL